MITETNRFNNNLLAFLVENQKYLDTLACSKGGSDRQINTHREHNIELINWYKQGNVIERNETELKTAPERTESNKQKNQRIPPKLKEKLREHEVELIEYMLKVGFYSSNDLWLTGVQRSINTYCQTINENGLDTRMGDVKECVLRVTNEMRKGNVKNKQAYLQTSLSKLTSNKK